MFIRKFVIIVSISMFASVGIAQQSNVTGLVLDSLINDMQNAINLQRSIEIEEIQGVYKITPWHFVPSLNYDFINERFFITISSGPFVSHVMGKRQETRRLSAINRRYENQIYSAEIRLRSLFITVNQRMVNLQLSHAIVSNDIEIFIIKQKQHANHEIDTETYLREKSTILNRIRNHNTEVAEVQRLLLDIELLTETVIGLDLSEFFISPAKILGADD